MYYLGKYSDWCTAPARKWYQTTQQIDRHKLTKQVVLIQVRDILNIDVIYTITARDKLNTNVKYNIIADLNIKFSKKEIVMEQTYKDKN